MPTFHRAQPGQPLRISAAAWNAAQDAARAHLQASLGSSGVVPATGGERQNGIVLVRNDSGSDQPRSAVLGIDGPIFTHADNAEEFLRQVSLKVVAPVEEDHADRFVILLDPLKAGAVGRAYVSGVCPVQIDMKAEGESIAGIVGGDAAKLESGRAGASIIWVEEGMGVRWGIVRIGAPPTTKRAKITGHSLISGYEARWLYNWTRVIPDTAGRYKLPPVAESGVAYNTVEANNGTGGEYGSGTVPSELPPNIKEKPIGIGAVVKLYPVLNCEDPPALEWHFEGYNHPGGACST